MSDTGIDAVKKSKRRPSIFSDESTGSFISSGSGLGLLNWDFCKVVRFPPSAAQSPLVSSPLI
jgi:hypothetical protein